MAANIDQFISLTGSEKHVAQTFLQQAGGNLEAAITFYFNYMEELAASGSSGASRGGGGPDRAAAGASRASGRGTQQQQQQPPSRATTEDSDAYARAIRLSMDSTSRRQDRNWNGAGAEPPSSTSTSTSTSTSSTTPPSPSPSPSSPSLRRSSGSRPSNNPPPPHGASRGMSGGAPPRARRNGPPPRGPPPVRRASMEEKEADDFSRVRRSSLSPAVSDVPDLPSVPITGVALEFGETLLEYGAYLTEMGSRVLERTPPSSLINGLKLDGVPVTGKRVSILGYCGGYSLTSENCDCTWRNDAGKLIGRGFGFRYVLDFCFVLATIKYLYLDMLNLTPRGILLFSWTVFLFFFLFFYKTSVQLWITLALHST